jgi:hypothetical protein
MNTQSTTTKHQRTVLKGKEVELDPMPDFPKPRPEHDWLHQFLGEWETEMACGPGSSESPITSKGTERVWSIGDLWIVAESKSEVMNQPMTSVLTLGYDLERKRYVGTWIGSSTLLQLSSAFPRGIHLSNQRQANPTVGFVRSRPVSFRSSNE